MGGIIVRLENITKKYADVKALDNINLEFYRGKINILLGPSGAGKTTLLRIIAGLERPDTGRVYIDGEDATNEPPWERQIAMVFQESSLFPHMTVYDNIAFGLEPLQLDENEVRRRVEYVSEILRIRHLLYRYPDQLSGGEAKRVALARALVVMPKILLLDEPLSNLDMALREELRRELRRIQRETKITFIYVTHDHDEALEMGDYIAIIDKGRIIEHGESVKIYSKPSSIEAARFWGHNIIELDEEISRILGLTTGKGYAIIPPFYLGLTYGNECVIAQKIIRRNHAVVILECLGHRLFVVDSIIDVTKRKIGERTGVELLVDKNNISIIHE